MKGKKILSGMLALAMLFSVNGGIVRAENKGIDRPTDLNKDVEYFTMSDDGSEVEPTGEVENSFNQMEHPYNGSEYTIYDGKPLRQSRAVVENTDPNNAYIVTNDIVAQGTIATAGEMRWYAFQLEEKSKVTILLQMVNSLDADLYVFSLDDSKLNLIGGSGTAGAGVTEYYTQVMEAGIYFFAVGGYEGTGNYAFAYYQSSRDVENEVNDLPTLATAAEFNTDIVGVIDTPLDVDYYKVTVSSPIMMRYSLSTEASYSLTLAAKDGESAGLMSFGEDTDVYKLNPGTYYFKVESADASYSAEQEYTVNFTKLSSLSSDPAADVLGICESANIFYQTNKNGTINYVNGHEIDPSYSYYKNIQNSAGTQLYDISIDKNKIVKVLNSDSSNIKPCVAYYLSSTMPPMQVGKGPLLCLSFYGDKIYNINCIGTGAYVKNTYVGDFNSVRVLIDPNSGDLVDILDFNYFYDYEQLIGSNYISYYYGDYELTMYEMK